MILEMLRLYFPAGQPIECPSSHNEFRSIFGVADTGIGLPADSSVRSQQDLASVKLLSRVFSLVNTPDSLKHLKFQLYRGTLDFELALFSTYAQHLKQNMKFVFQSILYQLFRSERLSKIGVKDYQRAVDKIALKK